MPLPPETPPTPMPGAKPSGGKDADPRASTDKASNAEESAANLTPAEKAHLDTHLGILQKLAGKVTAPGGTDANGKQQSTNSAVEAASQGVKDADSAAGNYAH
jgi:hypothetical protein